MVTGQKRASLAATSYLRELIQLQALVGYVDNYALAHEAGVAPNTITAIRARRPVTGRKADAVWKALQRLAQQSGVTLPPDAAPQQAKWRLKQPGDPAQLFQGRLIAIQGQSPYVSEENLRQMATGAHMTQWFKDHIIALIAEFGLKRDVVEDAFVEELDQRRIISLVNESILRV